MVVILYIFYFTQTTNLTSFHPLFHNNRLNLFSISIFSAISIIIIWQNKQCYKICRTQLLVVLLGLIHVWLCFKFIHCWYCSQNYKEIDLISHLKDCNDSSNNSRIFTCQICKYIEFVELIKLFKLSIYLYC